MSTQVYENRISDLDDEFAMHPVHGELTCVEVEASGRRAWEQVASQSEEIAALKASLTADRDMLASARRDLADAVAERTALREAVDDLTNQFVTADEELQVLDSELASCKRALAYLPDLDTMVDVAWRNASGKTTGPVPAKWKEHLASDEVAERIQRAVAQQLEAEYEAYAAGSIR